MKQRIILITKCIICDTQLTDHSIIKQELNESQTVALTTCSSGCRTKFYRDKQDRAVIKEAILKNDYSFISNFKISRLEALGFKVLKIV